MELKFPFRAAKKEDSAAIAQLFSISSGGVADYVWSTLDYPGLSPLEVGAIRYASEETVFSYRNCVVAERGAKVVGMLVTFALEEEHPSSDNQVTEPVDDVLAPYNKLELPGSWYICGVGVFPEYRGQGLGSQFVEIAHAQGREKGLREVSLIAFEQNVGAVRLYEQRGYTIRDRAPVTPHRLIRYTGDALLMARAI
ncbi:MAG: GNAT family N-acetyltransferase [Acidiferrobacterales bacterium]